jgi:hypothetical protein
MTPPRWFVGILALAAFAPGAHGQAIHYEGALSVASGNYVFTERTTSFTFSNGLALSAGPVTLRGTVPLLSQNTTLIAETGVGYLPTGGSLSGTVADSAAARHGGPGGAGRNSSAVAAPLFSESGVVSASQLDVPTSSVTSYEAVMGDPTLNLSVSLSPGSGTGIVFGGGVKVPVTDTSSYGTGQWDYGASLGLSQMLGSSTLLSADVSYWHFGDLTDLSLRDGIIGSASLAYLDRSGWGGSAMLAGARPIIEGFDGSMSVGAGITKVGRRTTMSFNISAGLTETTPDLLAGISWRLAVL